MRTQKITCDRCGAHREEGAHASSFRVIQIIKIEQYGTKQPDFVKDLCGACSNDIREFIAVSP